MKVKIIEISLSRIPIPPKFRTVFSPPLFGPPFSFKYSSIFGPYCKRTAKSIHRLQYLTAQGGGALQVALAIPNIDREYSSAMQESVGDGSISRLFKSIRSVNNCNFRLLQTTNSHRFSNFAIFYYPNKNT